MKMEKIIAKICEQLGEDDILRVKLETVQALLEYIPSYRQEEAVLNNVCLMGRLTADPRISSTQSGLPVASLTLAVDRDFGEGADFITCVSWRKGAEFAAKYLHKGMLIGVKGRLTTSSFTDKDEKKRTKVEVTVENFYFCEKRNVSTSTFEDLGDGDGGELPF